MNEQRLQTLLQQADAQASGPATVPADFTRQVRSMARRRHHVRQGIRVAAVLLLAATAGWLTVAESGSDVDKPRLAGTTGSSDDQAAGDSAAARSIARVPSATPKPTPVSPPADLRAELARLDAQADWHAQLAARMARQQRLKPGAPQSGDGRTATRTGGGAAYSAGALDLGLHAAQEAEVAARLMVMRADRLMAEAKEEADALAAYRRTINLFPKTAAADLARQRLDKHTSEAGERI